MKLLIADDNQAVRTTLKMLLRDEYERIVTTGDPSLLPAMLAVGDVDAVLLDMNFDPSSLDGRAGLFWLSHIMEMPNPPAVVVITAFGDVDLAVNAMKIGASDFITKPWDNDDLRSKLKRAIGNSRRNRQERQAIAKAATVLQRNDALSRMTLDEIKASHIRTVVERCGGNLSQAAEQLGINRQTLYNQLRRQS